MSSHPLKIAEVMLAMHLLQQNRSIVTNSLRLLLYISDMVTSLWIMTSAKEHVILKLLFIFCIPVPSLLKMTCRSSLGIVFIITGTPS